MFHDGFTKGPIFLTQDVALPVSIEGRYLRINPLIFLNKVCQDFNHYIAELREDSSSKLAHNFLKIWDINWKNT